MSSKTELTDPSSTAFTDAFDAFVHSYIDQSSYDNMGLISYFDQAWLSPCLQIDAHEQANKADGDKLEWRPFLRTDKPSLSNLEEALQITIPQELQQLFCRYYSHDLNAKTDDGALTILQAWNEEDFDRLQKNLIAHVLMKRRLKQDDTLFFALTDEDDFILSILLSNGAVMLEKVGKAPHREIAPSLTMFMKSLAPAPALVSL
jgi:SecY interacting protein Syd